MAIIMVHVGKNMVNDIFLVGGSRANAITDGLGRKLGLSHHHI
jgi:Ethanolamine utilization protein EutJ (predicted chaperonin)